MRSVPVVTLAILATTAGVAAQRPALDTILVTPAAPPLPPGFAKSHKLRAIVYVIGDSDTSVVDSATRTFTIGDSAGLPIGRMHEAGSGQSTDVTFGRAARIMYGFHFHAGGMNETFVGNGQTLTGDFARPKRAIEHITVARSVFADVLSDLLVETLPRRLTAVYRAPVWLAASDQVESHLYQMVGREDITSLGISHHDAWVVEERVEERNGAARLLGRMWLIDEPPYVVRWLLFSAGPAGSTVRIDQQVVHP